MRESKTPIVVDNTPQKGKNVPHHPPSPEVVEKQKALASPTGDYPVVAKIPNFWPSCDTPGMIIVDHPNEGHTYYATARGWAVMPLGARPLMPNPSCQHVNVIPVG